MTKHCTGGRSGTTSGRELDYYPGYHEDVDEVVLHYERPADRKRNHARIVLMARISLAVVCAALGVTWF